MLSLLRVAFLLAFSTTVRGETIDARWGQASALVGSLFVVQGGKTQSTGGYTYTSAPSDATMYALDLSTSFSTNSPPWQLVTANSAGALPPAVSFHSLTPINSTSMLLFGGDGSPIVPVQTNNDSAYIVNIASMTATYTKVPSGWAEPIRRIYHTTQSNDDGSVVIIGGEKADGSETMLDELWTLDLSAPSPKFSLGVASASAGIIGATSTLLSDGTMLLLGGMNSSGELQSFEQISALSTSSSSWTQMATQTSNQTLTRRQNAAVYPSPRRNHVAVSLPDKRVLIQGGASADLSAVYSDAWILDCSTTPPTWTQVASNSNGPSARYGHSAVAYGNKVVLALGWSGSNAADSTIHILDTTSTSVPSWTTSYTPDQQTAQQGSTSTGSSTSSSSGVSSENSSVASGVPKADSNSVGASTPLKTGVPISTAQPTDSSTSSSSTQSGGGTKAGIAIGSLVGVGLVVGAGYALYRKRRSPYDRRRGDGSAGLIDRDYAEKPDYSLPFDSSRQTAWNNGQVRHAMQGSGPHFTQRLAILTGIGNRDSHHAPRFDMLADENESVHAARQSLDEHEEADSPVWHNQQLTEHTYLNVRDTDASDASYMYDIGMQDHEYTTSPFEDSQPSGPKHNGLRSLAQSLTGRSIYGQVGGQDSYDNDVRRSDLEARGAPQSVLSLSNSSKSHAPESAPHSPRGFVSFSDSTHSDQAGHIKRSPTWWNRFFSGSSILERSTSGRSLATSRSSMPIRDPALPPMTGLEAIVESTRSRNASHVEDPFKDADGSEDQIECPGDSTTTSRSYRHGHARSSIGSTTTTASSHFDTRFQNMDVVQRVRTASSLRSGSVRTVTTISDTDSETALSRAPSTARSAAQNLGTDARVLANVVEEDIAHASPSKLSPFLDPSTYKRRSNATETPPMTTKRARQNPTPLLPTSRKPVPPLVEGVSSVRDRVKAIESTTGTGDTSTTPRSGSLTSLHSHTKLDDSTSTLTPDTVRKVRYTPGLAPRSHLFVANPDTSRCSDNSSAQS